MNIKSRIGVTVGVISIVLSTMCLLVMPVFTPAVILAPLVGIFCAPIAFALRAPRTAVVALVFAPTPLCGLLVMEWARIGYFAFIPLGLAFLVAVWTLLGYLRRRAPPPPAG